MTLFSLSLLYFFFSFLIALGFGFESHSLFCFFFSFSQWHWALVSGLGLVSVEGGVGVVAWVEIGLHRCVAAISMGLNRYFSVVVGCYKCGCGGLG